MSTLTEAPAVYDAYLSYRRAWTMSDLAGQVTAIRDMHRAGMSLNDLALLTECSVVFLNSLIH
jgi:hypothetical protein